MNRPARRGKRILALLTDGFGGFGGIAAYNRDLITAWCDDETIAEVVAVPRAIPSACEPLPDKLTHVVEGTGGTAAYLRTALRLAAGRERFDLVFCGHMNLSPLGWIAAQVARAPWLLQIHGIEAWSPAARAPVRFASRRPDHVFSVSQLTMDRFRSWQPVPAERCTRTPLALHFDNFAPGPRNPELEARYGLAGRKVIMTFGRLSSGEQYKGFDQILDALPALAAVRPEIAYLIAGHGDDRARLEAKAAALGVADRVVFTGMVDEAEKLDTYRLADIYAMPSEGEGFGYVLLEAMACGIPTIASTRDGGREAIREGMLGTLVDPREPQQLIDAILKRIDEPKRIPDGMDYFRFDQFAARIQAATRSIVTPV